MQHTNRSDSSSSPSLFRNTFSTFTICNISLPSYLALLDLLNLGKLLYLCISNKSLDVSYLLALYISGNVCSERPCRAYLLHWVLTSSLFSFAMRNEVCYYGIGGSLSSSVASHHVPKGAKDQIGFPSLNFLKAGPELSQRYCSKMHRGLLFPNTDKGILEPSVPISL